MRKKVTAREVTLPERMQIRRSARTWGRTEETFARLARVYGVRAEVIRALVMG